MTNQKADVRIQNAEARIHRLVRVRNAVLVMFGAVGVILLGLAGLGFPAPVTRWILAGVNRGDYYVAARDLKLDLRGGLDASEVTVYRKGLTGPPCFETRRLRVLYRLFEPSGAGHSRIKSIHARDGIVRPGWGGSPAGTPGKRMPVSLEFPLMSTDVILADFDVFGVWIEQARIGVETDSKAVRLSGITGKVGRDLQGGSVTGAISWERNGAVVGRVVTAFDPHALIPALRLLHPPAVAVLERFTFPVSPPRLDLSFDAKVADPVEVTVKGVMRAAQYAYRGAAIGFGNITWEYSYGPRYHGLKLDPFLLVVAGRHAQGRMAFDFKEERSSFEVTSAIDLATVLRLVGIKEQRMGAWQFEGGSQLVAKGEGDFRHPERTRYEATVEGGRVVYGPLRVNAYSARFERAGATNRLSEISGKIGGGTFVGSATIAPGDGDAEGPLTLRAELIHADADECFKALASDATCRTEGKLYGNIELSRRQEKGKARVDGRGQVALRAAKVFRIPVLSGFVTELTRIGPARPWSSLGSELRGTFTITEGTVESRDIRVVGEGLEANAQVRYAVDGALTGSGTIKWAKPQDSMGQTLRALWSPEVSARFTLGGTVAAPTWTVEKVP